LKKLWEKAVERRRERNITRSVRGKEKKKIKIG
jgi:hypothetical protein